MNLVEEGSASDRVKNPGDGQQPLSLLNIKAPKNGYAYIYVSNESAEPVYFDNLQIADNRGKIIEENHYYAYGLKIAAISSTKLPDDREGHIGNANLYNDKELFEEADLDWYDYGFRNYDPQIGRFTQLDPLTDDYPYYTPYQYAGCEPIANVDVDGLEPWNVVGSELAEVTVTASRIVEKSGSTVLKVLDGLLDFVPFLGSAKDIIIGAVNGDLLQAGMGVIGLVMDFATLGSSSIAKGTTKALVKEGISKGAAVRVIKSLVSEGKKIVERVIEEAIKHTKAIAEKAKQVTKSLAKKPTKKAIEQTEEDAIKQIRKEYGMKPGCKCFEAGTLVLTDSGYKKIEQLKAGNIVWAYNDTLNKYARKKVVRVFSLVRDTVYRLYIGKEIVKTTSDHPFFVGGRWMQVKDLKAGDSVTTYTDTKIVIDSIRQLVRRTTVHNFEVADYHSYYVSKQNILVHNAAGCNPNIPSPGKGKGTVTPSNRDPKRVWTKKEREDMLKKQDGKCEGCGQDKTVDEVQAHHKVRHADGGKTDGQNGTALCPTCHTEIHRQ